MKADRGRRACRRLRERLVWPLAAIILAACSTPEIRDGAPRDRDVSHIPDAVPRVEPITAAGNKSPYEVFGKRYVVLPTSKGYRERGIASWYGTKFHGRHTSNGEPYDMFSMSAAHKTLPIPSYVQVTNLDTGRQVIVRVNDRGPFHDDRIIDLSWAAAKKLGFADHGTARVEVVAIDPARYQRNSVESPSMAGGAPTGTFLQTGAFASPGTAEQRRAQLEARLGHPVVVKEEAVDGRTLFKVLVGPIADHEVLAQLQNTLRQLENLRPFVVYH